MMNETSTERQTARIVTINDLTSGEYTRKEGWQPHYVLTKRDEKLSRVNIMGIIVTIPSSSSSIFIDDGSEKIEVKSFENNQLFKDLTIGDIVMVIGKPREFSNQIYINGEIVKKVSNKGWLEYRKKELLLKDAAIPLKKESNTSSHEEETQNDQENDHVEHLLFKINEMDDGKGCEISKIAPLVPQGDRLIERLLLKGDIYEISPGKVRVLN